MKRIAHFVDLFGDASKLHSALPLPHPKWPNALRSCPRSDPMLSVLWRAATGLPQPSHPGPVQWTSARLPPTAMALSKYWRDVTDVTGVQIKMSGQAGSCCAHTTHHNPNFSLCGLPGRLPGSLGWFPGAVLQGHQLRPGRLKGRTSLTLQISVLSTA